MRTDDTPRKDFPEIRKFLTWYWEENAKGLILPVRYSYGLQTVNITDESILTLQLVLIGIKKISPAAAIALEALVQGLNEINDAGRNGPEVPRPDVF